MDDIDAATNRDGERVLRKNFAEDASDFCAVDEDVVGPLKLRNRAGVIAHDVGDCEGDDETNLGDDCDFSVEREDEC